MTAFQWRTSRIQIDISSTDGGPACLESFLPEGTGPRLISSPSPTDYPTLRQPLLTQPLVELSVSGTGHARSGQRLVESAVGRALVLDDIRPSRGRNIDTLVVRQRHDALGLVVESRFVARDDTAAVTVSTLVENAGASPVDLTSVSSIAFGIPTDDINPRDAQLAWARSDWLAENRWTVESLRDHLLPDLGLRLHGQDPRGAFTVSSTGTWSTGTALPMGVLHDSSTGFALAWQVESGTDWTWEIGERRQGLYLVAEGPDDRRQQWRHRVPPGESFESVPATIAVSTEGQDGAIAELTQHRRGVRLPHPDSEALPVVYNDYMNTLDADATTARLLPLIPAAADVGAETFVLDAGWYDDGTDWWDAVGEWNPSSSRFPDGGLGRVIDAIRAAGMHPGLWLEPEIVGERSPVADRLPAAAFFQSDGARVLEHGRFHLDLRHDAAVSHLDATVDRLVADFGIDYFKFDYNIDATGTDHDSDSRSDGLLAADRARTAWIRRLLDRHPGLTIENCGSGAMRADPATLETYQLQSTSDQQNWLLYPPIASAAPMSMPPEQAASWAYPQPEMSAEENAFTLVTGLSGRLYLSGFLDRMTTAQRDLVRAATEAFRSVRSRIATAEPFWPLGLPAWTDSQVALGYRDDAGILLFVWNRDPAAPSVEMALPLPHSAPPRILPLFPAQLPPWDATWTADSSVLTLTPIGGEPSARVFAIDRAPAR
ncbi:MAG: alpha-galactosidase [Frondihabitans sp.]|nr:alpha-galactosidase [Frondihabitans sp.]